MTPHVIPSLTPIPFSDDGVRRSRVERHPVEPSLVAHVLASTLREHRTLCTASALANCPHRLALLRQIASPSDRRRPQIGDSHAAVPVGANFVLTPVHVGAESRPY